MNGDSDTQVPLLAITTGDPAGIGPEISVRAATRPEVLRRCVPLLVGDAAWLARAADAAGVRADVKVVDDPRDAGGGDGEICVYDLKNVEGKDIQLGKVSAAAGRAAFEYVKTAIELALSGRVDGTVTAPINKEALNRAGLSYAGHTEIYADLTNTRRYTMMLAEGEFRVVHVSTHVSLRDACDRVKRERVLEVIRLAGAACVELGIASPRIAVAGLNPHCGEGGLFGTEEELEIRPAVEEARRSGIDVTGPLPADSLFPQAKGGLYDIVVAMYHDQGHIPLKLAGFVYDGSRRRWSEVRGVNITLGLPIIRTSVDHGTAFDQAGKGTASDTSLVNAITYAAQLAAGRSGGGAPRSLCGGAGPS